MLKYYFVIPREDSDSSSVFLPVGMGGCDVWNDPRITCITSVPYNKIPDFDFDGFNLGEAKSFNDVIQRCRSLVCLGFNSNYIYKYNFNNPYIVYGTDFYVHEVSFGTQFVQIKGWNIDASNIISPFSSTPSECAYKCTIIKGCVGAVFEGNTCFLKYYFVS